jgi:hypothetical protein
MKKLINKIKCWLDISHGPIVSHIINLPNYGLRRKYDFCECCGKQWDIFKGIER